MTLLQLMETPPTLTLRPYQHDLVNGVLSVMERGDKETLVISPTGSGKTVSFIAMCERLINSMASDEVILILSHLSLLTTQTKAKFNKFSSLRVGILQGQNMPDKDDQIIISTMQSSRIFDKIVSYYELSGKKVRYIIRDEAHLKWSNSYTEIADTFPRAQVIDLTATPYKNKRLATNGYDSVAFQISLEQLIEDKYLVPPTLHQIIVEDDTPEKKCALMLKTYLAYEKGAKAIMFTKNKAESKLLSDALVQEGVKSAVVTDAVTGVKRDKIFEGYDNDEYDVLVSVMVLSTGFDSLKCSSVFMYGSESPVVYMQRIGRALRPEDGLSVKPHHSKQSARIYLFGDGPTIESGEYEKCHNSVVRPKKFNECATIDEQVEWLEQSDMTDTEEYRFSKSAQVVQRLAKKIDLAVLSRLIEEKAIPAQFMQKLAVGADTYKPIAGGDKPASTKQIDVMKSIGLKPPADISSNEARFIIHSMTGESISHHNSDKYIVKEGKFKGSHVSELSWAFKSIVLRRYPASALAKQIREFHPRAK